MFKRKLDGGRYAEEFLNIIESGDDTEHFIEEIDNADDLQLVLHPPNDGDDSDKDQASRDCEESSENCEKAITRNGSAYKQMLRCCDMTLLKQIDASEDRYRRHCEDYLRGMMSNAINLLVNSKSISNFCFGDKSWYRSTLTQCVYHLRNKNVLSGSEPRKRPGNGEMEM
ncbi:Hypothetical predicted protein [Octopus vulgaris]|uniref:Uncharacterized protein n=1 Tax=Octopus vulgaris TaxID=6645 RepID=A0AA36AK95_OCTVU|nr:Hypothetical predicted protein [Octopus vulgaris]